MSQLNLIGTTLGRFEILSELGRGGMAVVYKARQTDLERIVALKILPPELTHDTSYIARFRQEARSAARLEHPHIMPVYEVGETSGMHYIAMKFIQGRTLKDLVQHEGALSVRRAAEILAQIGDALDYAHHQGVIHRDIKPSNIMITDEGWAYLTDFGLARSTDSTTSGLTMAGTVMGTPEYMSPEQAQGLPTVGPPTDIYAMGVVLYELLTGTFPFHAETPMAMLAARLLQAPIPPRDVRGDLPPAVEDVVMRALARKPEARFASSAEMVTALRAAVGIGATPQARPPLTPGAGTPAIGETIVAGAPGPRTPPYVQPQIPTPPPQPRITLPPLPTLPATPIPPQPVAAPAVRPKTGLFVGIGAAALLLVVIAIGGIVIARRPGPGPDPSRVTAIADPAIAELIAKSDAALAAGEIDTAIDGYQQVIDTAKGNLPALSGIALAHNLDADWSQAEASANNLVNAALGDDKAAALGLTLLADAMISQGGAAEAAEIIEQALDLDDDLALAHAIRSTITASEAADLGDTTMMDQALGEADNAVDRLTDETPVIKALTYNAIAITFSQDYNLTSNDSSLTESEADYGHAIELLPNIALFHSNLGYLYSKAERYSKARTSFEDALVIDPSYAAAQVGIGWSYYNQDQIDKAAEAFDAAVRLNPDEPDAYFAQGRLAYDKDDYTTAIAAFQSAVERNPRSASAHAWLGKSYQFSGFYENDTDKQAEIYTNAEGSYTTALEINPNDAFAASGLGWVLQYQDRYEESVRTFQRALEINQNDDEAYNGLGWSLFNLNRYDEAEPAFRRATEIAPDYASAHFGLGRALEELGRKDEARAAFQQTLTLEPSYTEAQDGLDRLGK